MHSSILRRSSSSAFLLRKYMSSCGFLQQSRSSLLLVRPPPRCAVRFANFAEEHRTHTFVWSVCCSTMCRPCSRYYQPRTLFLRIGFFSSSFKLQEFFRLAQLRRRPVERRWQLTSRGCARSWRRRKRQAPHALLAQSTNQEGC